jgi:hypothetical protein
MNHLKTLEESTTNRQIIGPNLSQTSHQNWNPKSNFLTEAAEEGKKIKSNESIPEGSNNNSSTKNSS